MKARELERLSDLLAKWSERHPTEGALRDSVAELRAHIDDELEERGALW